MDISAGEIEGSKFREGKVMIKEIPGASVNKKKNQNSRFTFLLTACPVPFPLPPKFNPRLPPPPSLPAFFFMKLFDGGGRSVSVSSSRTRSMAEAFECQSPSLLGL